MHLWFLVLIWFAVCCFLGIYKVLEKYMPVNVIWHFKAFIYGYLITIIEFHRGCLRIAMALFVFLFMTVGNICSKDVLEAIRTIEVGGLCSSPEKYIPVSSQMSVLPASSDSPCCHWFTATPFPSKSLFKPFIFCKNASVGNEVTFPTHLDHSAAKSNGEHALYTAHREFLERLKQRDAKADHVLQQLRELEANCLQDVDDIMQNYDASDSSKVSAIFSHIANLEVNFY